MSREIIGGPFGQGRKKEPDWKARRRFRDSKFLGGMKRGLIFKGGKNTSPEGKTTLYGHKREKSYSFQGPFLSSQGGRKNGKSWLAKS